MKCLSCTTSNRDERSFCSHCGVPLGWPCARCRFFNFRGEAYCGGCGGPGSESAAAPPGGRQRPARAPASSRSTLIRDEIQTYLKTKPEDTGGESDNKRVSQDDIDSLFQS